MLHYLLLLYLILHYLMFQYFDITLFDVPLLTINYFNVQLSDNALAVVAVVPVTLTIQAFIQALLSRAISPKRFNFFTVSFVNYLREVLPWWAPNRKFLKFRYPYCCKMHFRHSFWLQKHNLYIVCLAWPRFFLKL